jgi:hypothetical protein
MGPAELPFPRANRQEVDQNWPWLRSTHFKDLGNECFRTTLVRHMSARCEGVKRKPRMGIPQPFYDEFEKGTGAFTVSEEQALAYLLE